MKAGDKLTINATVRAVYAEWVELDLFPEIAPVRVPRSLLEPLVDPGDENADMRELASKPSTGKAKRTPNHDRA